MATILSFCQRFPETNFGAGDVLLAEGQQTGILYILIEGNVEILKGDIQITTVSEPGAIFGEISILLNIPHIATVKTLAPSRIHVIERGSEFLQSNPDITYQISRLLALRLQGVTTYLVDLKRQFEDQEGHLSLVDTVLETLVHQQDEECTPGSDREPDPTI